jgi:(5-formylfuran-3-yl)methyl phosphate synthase
VRLLVSVRDVDEAAAALAGGADVIDAKEPAAGALGAVSLETLHAIARRVDGRHLFTAALGDAGDERSVGRSARTFVAAGADLVKIGLAGTSDPDRAMALLASAAAAVEGRHVVAVAYADHRQVGSLPPDEVVRVAATLRLRGVLLDTADKQGPGLRGVMAASALAGWIDAARRCGLLVAVAGKLTAGDVAVLSATSADIVGVRGAACDGGRAGPVSKVRVQQLHGLLAASAGRTPLIAASGV